MIRDTERVTLVDGELVTLSPGKVYFNNEALPGQTSGTASPKSITVRQADYEPAGVYDFNLSLPTPFIDRDIYVTGDVINENGEVNVTNLDGSITVSGEIRAATVNISSARDFYTEYRRLASHQQGSASVHQLQRDAFTGFQCRRFGETGGFSTPDAVRGVGGVDVNLDGGLRPTTAGS